MKNLSQTLTKKRLLRNIDIVNGRAALDFIQDFKEFPKDPFDYIKFEAILKIVRAIYTHPIRNKSLFDHKQKIKGSSYNREALI